MAGKIPNPPPGAAAMLWTREALASLQDALRGLPVKVVAQSGIRLGIRQGQDGTTLWIEGAENAVTAHPWQVKLATSGEASGVVVRAGFAHGATSFFGATILGPAPSTTEMSATWEDNFLATEEADGWGVLECLKDDSEDFGFADITEARLVWYADADLPDPLTTATTRRIGVFRQTWDGTTRAVVSALRANIEVDRCGGPGESVSWIIRRVD